MATNKALWHVVGLAAVISLVCTFGVLGFAAGLFIWIAMATTEL